MIARFTHYNRNRYISIVIIITITVKPSNKTQENFEKVTLTLAALLKPGLVFKTLLRPFNNDTVARNRGASASTRLMEYAELRTLVLAGPHE